jgi:hypothetical protein
MGRGPRALLRLLALAWLLPACDKTDASGLGSGDPAATATASGTSDGASDEGVAPKSPPPPTEAAAAPAQTSTRTDAAASDAGPTVPTAADAPLLSWMKDHTAAAFRKGDSVALAAAFDQIATFAPKDPAYPNWASIARDGADAARAGSVEGVKAACRGCHEQYRAPYKATMRARRLGS